MREVCAQAWSSVANSSQNGRPGLILPKGGFRKSGTFLDPPASPGEPDFRNRPSKGPRRSSCPGKAPKPIFSHIAAFCTRASTRTRGPDPESAAERPARSRSGPRGPVPPLVQRKLYANIGFGASLGKSFSKVRFKDSSRNQARQSMAQPSAAPDFRNRSFRELDPQDPIGNEGETGM